jgi:ribosome-associated protein
MKGVSTVAENAPDAKPAGRALADLVAEVASSKLAGDLVILDMRDLVSYTDFLVICSARNERQAQAIADEVRQVMKDRFGMLPVNPARTGEFGWTVLDYMDCVLHVFTGDARELYDLEELWHEAPRTRVEGPTEETDPPERDPVGGYPMEPTEPGSQPGTR